MTTIRIDFENTNALKEWVLDLDKHLKENNLILVQINTSPKYLVGSHTFV